MIHAPPRATYVTETCPDQEYKEIRLGVVRKAALDPRGPTLLERGDSPQHRPQRAIGRRTR